MFLKNEKSCFIIKLITKYFVFGYLCLFGIIILLLSSYGFYKSLDYPKNLLSIIFLIPALPLLVQFLRILFSTRLKYRYYKISLYRLKTRGYKDAYFECEMHEPCFRVIIKDLLKSNGYEREYCLLREKCRGKNLRVERAKELLLRKVMKENSKKVI
ncbi:MAG: hypothetical protein K6C97_12430 [Treponema sp.]|nr:hypothetical protein [Treponema sp.]